MTKNERPVGIMISVEDAADTLFSDFFIDKKSGYAEWLFGKVNQTMVRITSGETKLSEHADAMSLLKDRLKARLRS